MTRLFITALLVLVSDHQEQSDRDLGIRSIALALWEDTDDVGDDDEELGEFLRAAYPPVLGGDPDMLAGAKTKEEIRDRLTRASHLGDEFLHYSRDENDLSIFGRSETLISLDTTGLIVSSQGIELISHIPSLQYLRIRQVTAPDVDLAPLSKLNNLHTLELGDFVLFDEPDGRFAEHTTCKISDETLKGLRDCTHLRSIGFDECPDVTGSGLAYFAKLRKLKVLSITNCMQLDSSHLAHLPPVRWQRITFRRVKRLRGEDIDCLRTDRTKSLNLTQAPADESLAVAFRKKWPKLVELSAPRSER